MHRILIDPDTLAALQAGTLAEIEGDEAQHAVRVKRVRPGEPVELMDGAGRRAPGEVAEAIAERRETRLVVRIQEVITEPPLTPRVEVWSAAPKGDRLEAMVDELSQIGVAAWVPVESALTARELTPKRAERLHRVCRESLKQCARAWTMQIGDPVVAGAAWTDPDARVLVADASGKPFDPGMITGATTIRLVVGPEGGWTQDELAQARAAGAATVSLGPHIMRIGTAAVAGAAVIIAAGPRTPRQ